MIKTTYNAIHYVTDEQVTSNYILSQRKYYRFFFIPVIIGFHAGMIVFIPCIRMVTSSGMTQVVQLLISVIDIYKV